MHTQTQVLNSTHGRLLCIADIRGKLSSLNDLAIKENAAAIIHTGDFGFFESASLDRINDRALRHLTMYSPLIPQAQRTHLLAPDNPPASIRATVSVSLLSEFPLLLSGQIKLSVPVYTTWGACEDVHILEKFRAGTYQVENLHILDEATTRCIDVGGIKLRLLGLGGALVPHKMFDNGDGNATIAGGQGTMWTTALQIGELVDTAQRVFDQTETRLLVTHASPGREGILAQLALITKADLTISAGLHFRYATSYNEFSVQPDFEGFRRKLNNSKDQFDKVWESVKTQVDAVIDENQRVLLDKALSVVEKIPPTIAPAGATAGATGEEPAWKNCWNWNLCDAAYGTLVLDINDGRVSAELKSQGFNYAYRRTATTTAGTPNSTTSALPVNTNAATTTAANAATTATNTNAVTTPTTKPAPTKESTSTPPSTTASPKPNGDNSKPEKKKFNKKDRREKDKVGDAKDTPPTSAHQPHPSSSSIDGGTSTAPASAIDEIKSPITDNGSGGARTPRSAKPQRNPNTIFMRTPVSSTLTEADIREFFADAEKGITKVHIPTHTNNPHNKIAYIEFGDDEAMKAGLEKHLASLKDGTVPEVSQAREKEAREHHHRGSGRGRGGRGGFAARGFAAAGLTKRNNNEEGKSANAESSSA